MADRVESEDLEGRAANATATAAETARVFVSYASPDAAVAGALVESLEGHGIPCWIAPRDVKAGALYADAIVRAISGAKALVLVLSESAIGSSHVGKEVERASSKKRPIIALRIDKAPLTPALEYFLSESQWVEAQSENKEPAYASLINAIQEPERAALGISPAVPPSAQTALPGRRNRILLAAVLAVVAVALAALMVDRFWPVKHIAAEQRATSITGAVSDKSIAVLPFTDMSEKHDQEYFADGMAEEILSLLATIPALKVVGRTSSFQFKGQSRDLRKIGDALGANYVVEGSVRRSGDRVRLTAQLIDAHTGTHLWSGTFERPVGDALKLQDEIAGNLARALQISLGAGDLELRPSLSNVDAYNLYLRGLQAVDRLDEAGFQEAVGYFKQSIDMDPTFAPAAGWLAMAYDMQGEWGYVAPATAFENARRMAEATIKIDPGFFLPYAVLASIHQVYDWDWAAGEAAVNRSIALAPREPLVHLFASRYALMLGRLDDALAHIQTTLARDPLMPIAYLGVCWIQQRRGHLQEAEAAARRALEISPSYVSGHYYLGLVLLARGEPKAALEAMRQETPVGGQLQGLAIVYFALGRRADSDAALARLVREDPDDYAYGIADVYAYRGEFDQAFKWLEHAYTQRDSSLYAIKGDPPLQRLEGDPRYKAFLHKMNLPE
jgi:TolB-like protein